MQPESTSKAFSLIRLIIFSCAALILIATGILVADLIKEGISSKIIARDTAVTDDFYWEIYREAFTKNFLLGFGWILMTGLCLFFAYRNGKTLFRKCNAAEQGAAANP